MNKTLQRWLSIFGGLIICTAIPSTANAIIAKTGGGSDEAFIDGAPVTSMDYVPTDIPYHSGDKYDMIIPASYSSSDDATREYLWLQDTLVSCPITHQNSLELENMTVDMLTYDASAAPLDIPNVKEITSVSYSAGGGGGNYSIDYYTVSGEYVILEYISDGRKNRYVKKLSFDADGDIIHGMDEDVFIYDGADASVTLLRSADSIVDIVVDKALSLLGKTKDLLSV